MNSFGFLQLISSFYRKKLPNLKKIEDKGLLAVKIAQHYALRVDFLSEDMCNHLSKLYTHSFPGKKQQLSEIIGDTNFLKDNFLSWEEVPFSSASVGQVHRGVTKEGNEVSIKIIRRDSKQTFLKDIENIENLVSQIGKIWPKFNKIFNPIGILENIKFYTLEELNLLNEYRDTNTLKKIKTDYENIFDLTTLEFPIAYKNLISEKILVSDLIKGDTFDRLLEDDKLSYETLLELFRLHSFYIFKIGIFHGDLHPGNVILGDDDKIYLIDCAGPSSITPRLQKGLFWFFYYLSRYDYENSAKYLDNMSKVSLNDDKFKVFLNNFLDLYSDFTNATVTEVSLTKRMMETIKLGINSGMDFGDDMFPVIKSLMYLDGMVMKCNPKAILMNDVRDFTDYLIDYIER